MNSKPFITIFTPTYNRGYIIENLYNSLLEQTIQNFEWIVIDDGSKDNTEEIMNKIINEKKILIKYIKKDNQGKYRAINDAIKLANGKLFLIVDSDDRLTKNCIEIIKEYYEQIKDKDEFIGVSGLRGKDENTPYTGFTKDMKKDREKNKYYDLEYIDADSIDYRNKYKIEGDRAEVCITEKLKNFQFPENNNEKFMSEGYMWNYLAMKGYKFRWFNKVIYLCEYLNDGLSKNYRKILLGSPTNEMKVCNQTISISRIGFKKKFKSCIKYYRYGKYAKKNLMELFAECNNKLLSLISIPIALLFPIK